MFVPKLLPNTAYVKYIGKISSKTNTISFLKKILLKFIIIINDKNNNIVESINPKKCLIDPISQGNGA